MGSFATGDPGVTRASSYVQRRQPPGAHAHDEIRLWGRMQVHIQTKPTEVATLINDRNRLDESLYRRTNSTNARVVQALRHRLETTKVSTVCGFHVTCGVEDAERLRGG